MADEDTRFLKSVRILAEVDEDSLGTMAERMERKTYHSGEFVLMKGEVPTTLFIIREGSVLVNIRPKKGDPFTKALSPGDFFGEMSFLEGTAATASIKATQDGTEILAIPHSSIESVMASQPAVRQALLDTIASRRTPA